MKKFGKKLFELRAKTGLSQTEIAKKLTYLVEPTTSQKISKWENDYSVPNAYQFLALCNVLNIRDVLDTFNISKNSLDKLNDEGKKKVDEYIELLLASGMYTAPEPKIVSFTRSIRLFDLPASAGTGEFLDSESYTLIDVGKEVPESTDFGVKITGNSMEPQFVDGQIVWVHQQNTLNDGELGIFSLNGNAYCKKLSRIVDCVRLISLNKNYAPIEISIDDIFHVFGKVVG